MSIRIPTSYGNRQTLLDLQRSKERFASLQLQLASGKRINTPADDPAGAALILDLQNSIGRNEQYLRQIESARSSQVTTETVLSSANDLMMRLGELATQGLGTSNTAASRNAIADEVEALRTSLIQLANTEVEGKYLFSGAMTGTVPFADPTGTAVSYQGDSTSIQLNIGASSQVTTNFPGDQVFQGNTTPAGLDIFQVVTNLRDHLRANDPTSIQADMADITTSEGQLLAFIVKSGAQQTAMDQAKANLGNFNLTLSGVKASFEETDYPSTMVAFNAEDVSQKAALSAMAKNGRQNLFDYLG